MQFDRMKKVVFIISYKRIYLMLLKHLNEKCFILQKGIYCCLFLYSFKNSNLKLLYAYLEIFVQIYH